MRFLVAACLGVIFSFPLHAQKEYGFDNRKASGQPYLSPEETVRRMKPMPGFSVKLFASEPLMTNPIAMTVDDKGRVWIIESFEYPKLTPPGKAPRDRIVILEDTDGDGVADKRTVFAEGKDFPVTQERAAKGQGAFDMASGIEVYGNGCFIGAPPYLWQLKDEDNDGKADSFEIVASGFGSQDTHETLNTFTWGPDGWLYGLHGVFTISKVTTPAQTGEPAIDMDAGVWRYHPVRKIFEMFAEGTSNPWGMDFNKEGECFICCCVIPHLFHIVPGGIYIKQGSKPSYNPYAYGALKEICDHTFHKESGWAHAGLLCLDAPHFPKELQGQLIFGSIHGCSIKRNSLKPHGSTFISSREDDFLVSGDKNFRPIQMRWAPDGSILVSDWHDQNPCHQTKPDDWDYERGRIYRIIPPAHAPLRRDDNPFWRKRQPLDKQLTGMALEQRKLLEHKPDAASLAACADKIRNETDPRALQALASVTVQWSRQQSVLPLLQAWFPKAVHDDAVIPFLIWLATEKELQRNRTELLQILADSLNSSPLIKQHLLARITRRLAAMEDVSALHACLQLLQPITEQGILEAGLSGLAEGTRGRKITFLRNLGPWHELSHRCRKLSNPALYRLLQQISVSFLDPEAVKTAQQTLIDSKQPLNARMEAVAQLGFMQDATALPELLQILKDDSALELKQAVARSLTAYQHEPLAQQVLAHWNQYPSALQSELITTLRSRKPWARALLLALADKTVSREQLHDNIALAIRQFKDRELNELLDKHYGVFHESPAELEKLLEQLRKDVAQGTGQIEPGKKVFEKHCMQCHKFEGQGHDVGPVLDGAERTREYLLSNIVDPNRVVGTPYFTRTIVLKNGKLITGLLVEEDANTIRLKRENAVIEVIPKAEIEEQATSTKSLMPEGMSRNMTIQELRDLIRYLEHPTRK